MLTLKDKALIDRVKSYLWRAGMMAIAAGVTFLVNNISDLQLSPMATGIIGLLPGEVSKYLNNKAQGKV